MEYHSVTADRDCHRHYRRAENWFEELSALEW